MLKFSFSCSCYCVTHCILYFRVLEPIETLGFGWDSILRAQALVTREQQKRCFHGCTRSVSSFMFYQLVLIKICRQSSNHNMLITFQNRCAEVLASCLRKAMRKEQGKKYVENSSLILFLTMRSKICLVESFRDFPQLELLLKMLTYTCSMSLPVILT